MTKLVQEFSLEPALPPLSARPDQVERALKAQYHDATSLLQPQGKELDLLIVILPENNGSLYGMVPHDEQCYILSSKSSA